MVSDLLPGQVLGTDDRLYLVNQGRPERIEEMQLLALKTEAGDRSFLYTQGQLVQVPDDFEAMSMAWLISQELGR